MKQVIIAGILGFLALLTLLFIPVYLKLSQEFSRLESDDPVVWETAIRKFEEEDKAQPPAGDAVLFVGSSSIRFWSRLKEDFPSIPIIQRGFGGSKLSDIIHYADRIIFKYHPRTIVLFAGTNDITGRPNDKTAEMVFEQFRKLAGMIRKRLPQTQLIYLPITPTTARWHIWPEAQKANELIASYVQNQSNMTFIDTQEEFINPDGTPRKNLLWWDGVHLNRKGYSVWKRLLEPKLL